MKKKLSAAEQDIKDMLKKPKEPGAKRGAKKGNKSARIGDKYKYKTKAWLKEKGFTEVEYIERYTTIPRPGQMPIRIKRDLFGSDILAFNRDQMVFVQVKYWTNDKSRQTALAAAKTGFGMFSFPDFVDKWIVLWEKGGRNPEVVEV